MRKITAFLLSALLLFGCCTAGVCAEDAQASGQIKIINYNVDGLPIPSGLSSTGRNVLEATIEIARQLKAENANLIGVQEDFEFHPILKSGLSFPDATYADGGTGTGSGLNLFSTYALYNVGRLEWDAASGVFDSGSDELTPKGVVYATIELAPGAYVDVYNCHADSFDDESSQEAKKAQYAQLKALVDSHSKGRAVIITGDLNAYFTSDSGKALRDTFIPYGFKEAWVECENAGDYDFTYEELYSRYNVHPWGNWDSVEKTFYRDSEAVKFTAESNEYRLLKDADDKLLSDHAAQIVVLSYDIVEAAAEDNIQLRENTFDIGYLIASFITNLYDTIVRILKELPKLITGEIKLEFMK